MKKNLVLIVLLVAFSVVASGCMAGPFTITNTVSDWSAGVYADNAYIGTVVYVFVQPIGWCLGMIADEVVFNMVAWWGQDVWDGKGTTYDHKNAPNGKNNKAGNAIMEQPQM